jgi:hypothetical protein
MTRRNLTGWGLAGVLALGLAGCEGGGAEQGLPEQKDMSPDMQEAMRNGAQMKRMTPAEIAKTKKAAEQAAPPPAGK